MQSEPYTIPLRDKQTMPPVAASFAKYVGCKCYAQPNKVPFVCVSLVLCMNRSIGCAVTDAACMRGKSADDVLKAQIYVDTDISTDLLQYVYYYYYYYL